MEKKDLAAELSIACSAETNHESDESPPGKRVFIEPKVSVPVDVLEVTTFQQPAESGTTN